MRTPCPERDGVPLLDLEALVGLAGGGGGGRAGRGGSLAGGGGRRRRVDVGLHGGHRARSREPSIRFDSIRDKGRSWRVFVLFAQFLLEARGFMEKENEVRHPSPQKKKVVIPCCASQMPLDRNFGRLVLLRLSLPAAMKTINENDRKTVAIQYGNQSGRVYL